MGGRSGRTVADGGVAGFSAALYVRAGAPAAAAGRIGYPREAPHTRDAQPRMPDMQRPAHAESRAPTQEEAEEAVRTLIRWAGDDPGREGLLDTPRRVVRAYREFFAGYGDDPAAVLLRTFEEVEGYDEMIVLRDIRFESH